jgi:hypothetical protein
MSFEEEIVLFIKAKSPLIYIVCAEEERVEYALRRLMTSKLKRVVYSWDFVNGFTPNVLNTTSGDSKKKRFLTFSPNVKSNS